MKIKIPEFSLVLFIGASGSGKTTFARKHFRPTEVLSSDTFRAMVSDDENDQSVTRDAFDILHLIAARRLARRRLTVIDATNVKADSRKSLLALARKYHTLPVAIVLRIPQEVCCERNKNRPDRCVGDHIIRQQWRNMKQSLGELRKEGFRKVWILDSPEKTEEAVIHREPLRNNKRDEQGPFDIIGDVHGCFDEMALLLEKLGYGIRENGDSSSGSNLTAIPPRGRKAIFVGDLVDRGPKVPESLGLVMNMVQSKTAFCVPGNHENRLLRKLSGKDVPNNHGLKASLEQLEKMPRVFHKQIQQFIKGLPSHYVFDKGNLVVAHAGMKAEMQGRTSGKVRLFALYGETIREVGEYGPPVRHNWAAKYRGNATVVYGHTPVPEAEWLNRTINIDTGCVFGGKLTAIRYPEKEIISVPAKKRYQEPVKP